MAKKTKTKPMPKRKFTARHVIKRAGHVEPFDERKIYASVYEAAHATGIKTVHAEKIAASVTEKTKKWMEKKDVADSREIQHVVVNELRKNNADMAFLYQWHMDIC